MVSRVFLTARWQNLIMANYAVDADILTKHLPNGTELDFFNGHTFVSLVGFQFFDTRLLGLPVPFHQNFEEVNLRFYVRVKDGNEWKRGTVFFKEIVPKPMITFVANTIYGEHYATMKMKHFVKKIDNALKVNYLWQHKNHWNALAAEADLVAKPMRDGSEEEFIAEHYWGYTRLDAAKTSEYQVAHPRWQVHEVQKFSVDCAFGDLYGSAFSDLSQRSPSSVFMAEGSTVEVFKRRVL